jgi:hypothetical protein
MTRNDTPQRNPDLAMIPPPRWGRSAGAVLAGLFAIFAITTATDVALHATGVFPPMGQPMSDALFGLATAYRVVYGVLGCYIAARLAPQRPLAHALALGALGFAFSTLGAILMWDAGPAWYCLAIIAIAPPSAWLGGTWREHELRTTTRRRATPSALVAAAPRH